MPDSGPAIVSSAHGQLRQLLVAYASDKIKKVEKTEKGKPENIGRHVQYDWKERCVTIDDHIIDSFNPSFF